MEIKLTTEEIRYIALFKHLTGAEAIDCILDEKGVIFVVKKGDMGLAIGKKGININRVKKSIGNPVEVVEYSDDAAEFIQNSFYPVPVKKIKIFNEKDKKLASVGVTMGDRGLAIGKNGRRIKKAKRLAQRHYGIDDVIIN